MCLTELSDVQEAELGHEAEASVRTATQCFFDGVQEGGKAGRNPDY